MEIDRITDLLENLNLSIISEKESENYRLIELRNEDGAPFTLQLNDKGIVSIYYRNSQFYDEPENVLHAILKSAATSKMVARERDDGLVYYCAKLDTGDEIKPERIDTTQGFETR